MATILVIKCNYCWYRVTRFPYGPVQPLSPWPSNDPSCPSKSCPTPTWPSLSSSCPLGSLFHLSHLVKPGRCIWLVLWKHLSFSWAGWWWGSAPVQSQPLDIHCFRRWASLQVMIFRCCQSLITQSSVLHFTKKWSADCNLKYLYLMLRTYI